MTSIDFYCYDDDVDDDDNNGDDLYIISPFYFFLFLRPVLFRVWSVVDYSLLAAIDSTIN